ncbi:aspartate/glutamate racemase [Veronia nyctiphanis]|uniref:Aspartate/glutamate racemase n=1 Tax=Veronia nyctiphanis TaxID=1278244 RepID=A0A4Q0YTJ9_9GAMM|nr:aspartate/glutamate racemase family protein [Veronia nyctiphanis]RXJ74043.1 aspartate/glutamate racemase [Veronia nyctiphanis]
MKTIGMIGGMSWESTALYYKTLNEEVKARKGGFNSAQCLLYSVNFAEIEALQRRGDWQAAGNILADTAANLERGGADLILICTNTMHLVFEQVQDAVSIPVIHIADTIAAKLQANEITKVGLLATGFTMEKDFYKGRLQSNFGIDVIVPDEADRAMVHDVIYNQLCLGEIREESKQAYLRVIDKLAVQGAQAVILGCTEIGLLISGNDTEVPLFDTTAIHAEEAVSLALDD